MVVKRLSIFFVLWFVLLLPCFPQEYPTARIEPWTTKSGEQSTYFKMVDWDSSPYKEFTYIKRSGPNTWDITEYLNFRMLFPKEYNASADEDKKYPIIIFLHGAGESGIKWTGNFDYANGYKDTPPEPEKIDNNDHQLRFGGHEFLVARNRPSTDSRAFPGFFVFPQVPYNGSWSSSYDDTISKYNRQVIELIEILLKKYKVDPNRIYVMGLSNGAHGVWDLINRRPDLFAATIVFSGVGDSNLMAKQLAHFPIWIFQGGQDDNPTPAATNKMVNALKAQGGTPRMTVYDTLGHNVWDKAFKEPDFFKWLLSNSKLSIHAFGGETQFEKSDNIQVVLGISPGFSNYQWKYNGEVVNNSDKNTFIANGMGAYQVRFKRGETWTSWSDPIFITSEDNKLTEDQIVYRINVGGPALLAEPANWSSDSDSKPSPYLLNRSNNLALTTQEFPSNNYAGVPDAVFETGRQGDKDISYSFPFQGKTEATLYFTRPQNNVEHVLNVIIEGENVAPQLNIGEEGGTDALKKTFQVRVKDHNLDIVVENVSGNPILSGIEVSIPSAITGLPKDSTNPVKVYPNPFNTSLSIALDANTLVDYITIRDLTGKIIYIEKWNWADGEHQLSSSIATLSSGIYFLEISFRNKDRQLIKIIKN